jgi:predicted phosphodiesterase
MDTIAIISDVHGNTHALEAVLADIRQRGIETIYNLGDLVGKGPQSGATLERCREVCQVVVRGNWDDVMLHAEVSEGIAWYRDRLSAEQLAYLASLPGVHDFWLSGKRVRLFHASAVGINHRVHPWSPFEELQGMFANTEFTGFDQPEPDIVGYGDIHGAYMLSFLHKSLFNVGSVGNPLDMPLATYAILSGTLDSRTSAPFAIDFVRLPYDIEAAVDAARQVNMPQMDAYIVELRTAVYRGRQTAIDN